MHFEAHGSQTIALFDGFFHCLKEIAFQLINAIVQVDIGIAGEGNDGSVLDFEAAEQRCHLIHDHLFEEDIGAIVREENDGRNPGRHTDEGIKIRTFRIFYVTHDIEHLVNHVREGMARVDDEWRKQRHHIGFVVFGYEFGFTFRQCFHLFVMNAGRFQLLTQHVIGFVTLFIKLRHLLENVGKLFVHGPACFIINDVRLPPF